MRRQEPRRDAPVTFAVRVRWRAFFLGPGDCHRAIPGPTKGQNYRTVGQLPQRRRDVRRPVRASRNAASAAWDAVLGSDAPGALVLTASEASSEGDSVTEKSLPLHHPLIVEDHPPAVAHAIRAG